MSLAGCTIGENFTFRSSPDSSLEEKWKGLDPKTRNLIRTAGDRLSITPNGSIEDVIELSRQHRQDSYQNDDNALRRIALAASAACQAVTLAARDTSGRCAGAATLVWDSAVLYYWQASIDRSISGCSNLLVWESMKFAHAMGRVFDLDGFHSESSARFTASFGFPAVARPTVIHLSQRGRYLQAAGRLLGRGQSIGVPPL